MLLLINKNNKKNFLMDYVSKDNFTATYSLRKLASNSKKAIKIRDDTNTKIDIGFTGENLNTVDISSWLNRNILEANPLGIDSNNNGVSDGWTIDSDISNSSTSSIDGEYQKIEVLSMTGSGAVFIYKEVSCVEKNNITASFIGRVSNINTSFRLWLIFYNGSSVIKATDAIGSSSQIDTTLTLSNIVAPTNTTKVVIRCTILANSSQIGTVWFKNASLKISNQSAYVETLYDQSGKGNNATQLTASYQPRIVNQGIVDRDFNTSKINAMWSTFISANNVNLVSNGNFSNGTVGWSTFNSTNSSSNNTLINTANGTSAYGQIASTSFSSIINRRYFGRCKVRVTNSVCTEIKAVLGTNGFTLQTNPIQNQWYTLYFATTAINTNSIMISHHYADATTANNKVMEIQEVVCIDVTDLGSPCMFFDGINDFFSISNLSMFRNIFGSTVIAVSTNLNPNNGDTGHYIFYASKNGSSTTRVILVSRLSSVNQFIAGGRRLDSDTFVQSASEVNSVDTNSHIITGKYDFSTGDVTLYVDGIAKPSMAYSSGSGVTSDTDSQAISIGAIDVGNSKLKGYIQEILIGNKAFANTNQNKIEKNQSKYYGISIS